MNRIRRLGAAVATLAGAVLAMAAASPAFARPWPPPGVHAAPARPPAQIHTVVIGGTPGWQIVLIAAGAAVATATAAVLIDRARAARKMHATTA